MELSMRQGVELSQTHKLEQKHELLVQLSQKIALSISALLAESGHDPASTDSDVYDRVTKAFDTPELKEVFQGDMKDAILQGLQKRPHLFVAGDTSGLALSLLYDMYNGSFPVQKDDDTPPEHIQVPLTTLHTALKAPGRVSAEIENLEEIMKQQKDSGMDVRGMLREIGEKRQALRIISTLNSGALPMLDNMFGALQAAKDPQTGETLQEYMSERIIFEDIIKTSSMRVSDQLTRRARQYFAKKEVQSFKSRGTIPPTLERAILNHVGKLVLIGLGIVDKDLFIKKSGTTEMYSDDEFRKEFEKMSGQDPIEMLQKHNLSTEKHYYFSRYKTNHTKPSSDTDDKIRDFFTTRIRQDKDALLEAMDVHNEYHLAAEPLDDDASPDERDAYTSDFIANILTKETFATFLKAHLNTYAAELAQL